MARDGIRGSLIEALVRMAVGDGLEERLVAGFASPQRVEVEPLGGEVELRANEPMDPRRGDQIGTSQHLGFSPIVGATKKDHPALRPALQIDDPGRDKWPAGAGPRPVA